MADRNFIGQGDASGSDVEDDDLEHEQLHDNYDVEVHGNAAALHDSIDKDNEGSIDQAGGSEDSDSFAETDIATQNNNRLIPHDNEDDDVLGLSAGPLEHKPISDAYFRDHQRSRMSEALSPSQKSRIPVPTGMEKGAEQMYAEDDSDSGEDEDGLGHSNQSTIPMEGEYDPAEFMHLPVTTEIKDLFAYIGAYRVQTVDVEPVLKPFILDYIPAVGDIDAFIKIPRPDEVEDNLGLTVLDEPCAEQSDPTVLGLHLRAINKEAVTSEVSAQGQEPASKQLTRADRNPREIDQWIKNINELHRTKPATNVHYTKPMPDIDTLMQEWPPQVEEMLKKIELPTGDMNLKLEEYVDLICPLLDIPVHKGKRIHSLHVLFTLYSEFKNSQHFRALAEQNNMENVNKNRSKLNHDTLEL